VQYTRQNPFYASIKSRACLNRVVDSEETRQTWHVELNLHDSGIQYVPGDSIAVLPENDLEQCENIISHLNAVGDELIDGVELRDFLHKKVNIATPTRRLLEALQSPHAEDEKQFAKLHTVEETLKMHGPLPLDVFVKQLSPLLPRFYSIASSKQIVGEEVHLLVAYVNYTIEGKSRKGICSHYLCDQVEMGARTVPIYPHPTRDFRLPSPEVPIIMIGPGTGVAPYRAFMQERLTQGAKKNWLFFGERHRKQDFFYEEFWSECVRTGMLRLDCAFSRDQAEKVYVQHVMWEKRADLFKALEEGAALYVCGDAHHMAKDVDAMLHKIVESEGGKTVEAAREYVKGLRSAKRYLRDVY